MPSFTQRLPNLQQLGPVIEVMLTPSVLFLQTMGISPSATKAIKVLAMIDTGASGTVISQGFAASLGINPVGTTMINTPSSTHVSCYQFDIQLVFPNNVNIASIVVTEAPLKGQHIQCLIGRDVLQHGVLIYTGYDNSFTLSF
ncbi:MAG: retroviral-like aspartic protease family protein [Bacteroidetes bacterium]|nr:retroviral-like aspartic protease family protein [Bacteroidota bacterium]